MMTIRPLLFPIRTHLGRSLQLISNSSRVYSNRVKSALPITSRSFLNQHVSAASPLTRSVLQRSTTMPLAVHLAPLSNWSRIPKGNRLTQSIGVIGTGALLLWGKGKYLLVALKLTKLASLGSMVLTIGTYSMFFGVPYAVGMVGLITVHEAGHALVMLQRGIPFSPMVFVPFMGAVIAMNQQPRDAWEDALVAFGGPVLGSAGALGVMAVGHMTDSQLMYALADFGFMVNLFNMMPIGSMDGGRIAGALSPYAGLAGLGMGGLMAFEGYVHNPIFYLILLAGGYETFQRFYNPHMIPPNYYRISSMQRATLTGGYFGLVGALIAATAYNNHRRKSPQVLQRERMHMERSWDERY